MNQHPDHDPDDGGGNHSHSDFLTAPSASELEQPATHDPPSDPAAAAATQPSSAAPAAAVTYEDYSTLPTAASTTTTHEHHPAPEETAVMDAVLDVMDTHPHNVEHAAQDMGLPPSLPEPPAPKRQRLNEEGEHISGMMMMMEGGTMPHASLPDAASPSTLHQPMEVSVENAAATTTFKKQVHHEQWNEMLERLRAYKQKYGDCLVPKRYTEDPKLGTWVETQRVQFKRLPRVWDEATQQQIPQPNKRLTAERLQKLTDLGFCWSAKHIRRNGSTGSLASSHHSGTPATATANNMANASFPVPSTVQAVLSPPTPPLPTHAPVATSLMTTNDPTTATANNNNNARRKNVEEDWDDYYQRLVDYKQQHGNCLVPRKYEADPKLAQWVEQQRCLWNRDYNKDKSSFSSGGAMDTTTTLPSTKQLTPERYQKLQDLGFVWSLRSKRIEDHWDEMYRQLVEYKEQHGDCLVPSRYEQNLKLGKWVETQRYEYTKLQRVSGTSDNEEAPPNAKPPHPNPRLTPERLRRLEAIGFEWKVKNKMKRYYDKQWDSMFQQLLDFKQKYGHVNVPKRYPENLKLGTWCHTQRIQYRKLMAGKTTTGKSSNNNSGKTTPVQEVTTTMSATHSPGGDAMDSMMHPQPTAGNEEVPSPSAYATAAPEGSAAAAQQAVEDSYGDSAVAQTIANWTAEQAQNFRLTEERRKRLEDVGFCWSAREGNEKATLETSGRISRNSYDDQWDAMFAQLVKYKEEHGDCLVPKRYLANPKLGTGATPNEFNETGSVGSAAAPAPGGGTPLVGRLTQDRIQRLQNLGFVWSLRDDWATHYEELKAYKAVHGHCNVPARYSANRRLGIWVSAQRQQYKILQSQRQQRNEQLETAGDSGDNNNSSAKARRSAPLTQERIDLLNANWIYLDIRSRDALGESWNQRLYELRQFKDQYGHCLVPSRYEQNPELGVWVSTQRSQYRLYMRAKEAGAPVSTNMNEDRIRELEELGFVWNLRGPPSVVDEVAAAEAAATAVEIADQVAVGSQFRDAPHDPTATAPSAAAAAYHSYPMHHPPNDSTGAGDSSHEYIAAI
eukprot:CAMPEP_0176178096 /NCGR_PEP_ID=MMETSP0120_2-20121206/91256_1 /TAXON_ID=160619 /ORGANISM="Kryptoperidinium foliaceum, Strain CCMP 1326" /LENGTH=1067 /DNA_ID=CAMNT_0017516245 /DNA_START=166 /DNA_END=3371 /DNA_ORIENTATION=+